MVCETCGEKLTAERLKAVPDASQCVSCLEKDGDVYLTRGVMVWDHKTAPELVIGDDAEKLLPYQRRGFSAQLPLNSVNNPRMVKSMANVDLSKQVKLRPANHEDFSLEVARFTPATCHPERQRISPNGMCMECAVQWYQRRAK